METLFILIILSVLFALWILTISPLIKYGPFLRRIGVRWPNCLPPPIGYIPTSVKSSEEIICMVQKVCYAGKSKIPYLWRGTRPMLFLNTPQLVEQLLKSSQVLEKDPIYRLFHPWLRTGLASSEGEKWKFRRRLLTPAFHFSVLKSYFTTILEQTFILKNIISEKSIMGEAIDAGTLFSNYSLDVICEAAMGVHPNAQTQSKENEYLKAIETLKDLTFPRAIRPYLWFDWIYKLTSDGQKFQASVQVLHDFTIKTINARLDERSLARKLMNNNPNVKEKLPLLDLLLSKFEDNESIIDIAGIEEEVNTFMVGGHDTTSNSLTWALQCIAENASVQEKIHDELESIFGKPVNEGEGALRKITFEDLSNLNYMEKVIRETLRLYPSVVVLIREVREEGTAFEVNGDSIIIPSNTLLAVSPYALHRDPDIYPDPDKFDPGRFDVDKVRVRHPYAYIPFSAGPRNCIGQKFGIIEMKTALAEILRSFKVVALQSRSLIGIKPEMLMRPRLPVMLKFLPR